MKKTIQCFLAAVTLWALALSAAPAFADTPSPETADHAKAESAASISDTARSASTGIAAPMERGDSSVGLFQAAEDTDPAAEDTDPAAEPDTAAEGETSSDGIPPQPGWTPEMGLPELATPDASILNDSQLLISWTGAEDFDGYQISYAKNALFLRDKKIKKEAAEVSSPDNPLGADSCHMTLDVNTAKQFYIRVRGYRVYEGDIYYSGWAETHTQGKSAAGIKYVKDGSGNLDVRKQAWSDLKYFGISQGSCSDGTYVYMCFEFRNGDDNGSGRARIKIAKVRISDWTVVNVSPTGQKLGHANDITWNPDQGYLVVTGAKTNDPYVRLVSPETLKKIGRKKIKLGPDFSYVKAFNAIDYDPETKTYYIRSRFYGSKCFTLDQNFRIISDATMPTVWQTRSVQSCTSLGDYFLLSQSWYQSSSKNSLTIFDKAGTMIQHIKIKVSGELESLFFIGDQLYATVHKHVTSGYMTGFIFRILL